MKYDTSNMEKCEYIEAMQKVYSKRPKQENGRCYGFRNKYSGVLSSYCQKCKYIKRD